CAYKTYENLQKRADTDVNKTVEPERSLPNRISITGPKRADLPTSKLTNSLVWPSLASRGLTTFEIFLSRVPPVETDTGIVCISGPRTIESGVFVSVQ